MDEDRKKIEISIKDLVDWYNRHTNNVLTSPPLPADPSKKG